MVNPGGCSGFSYGMGIDDHYAEDDEVIEQNGMLVFVDAYSAQYLDGVGNCCPNQFAKIGQYDIIVTDEN